MYFRRHFPFYTIWDSQLAVRITIYPEIQNTKENNDIYSKLLFLRCSNFCTSIYWILCCVQRYYTFCMHQVTTNFYNPNILKVHVKLIF